MRQHDATDTYRQSRMSAFYRDHKYRLQLQPIPDLGLADGVRYVEPLATQFCRGRGIDVGATQFGAKRGLTGAVPIDDDPDLNAYAVGSYDTPLDYVFSSHTLEHLAEPERALREWCRVLRPGGVLFLYLPFPGHPHWDPFLCPEARAFHWWQPDPVSVGRLLLLTGFQPFYTESAADELHSFVSIALKLKE